MLGMEMLLTNALGISPDQMRTIAEKLIHGIEQAAADMAEIRAKVDAMAIKLEEMQNERGSGKSGNGSDVAGTGNGSAPTL